MTDEIPVPESEQPERTPGREEQRVLDAFEQVGWRSVSFEQLGPDGTEVLAVMLFHLCPVCAACVPLGSVEDPHPDLHRAFHISEAQAVDELTEAMQMLLSRVFGLTSDDAPPKADA